MKDETVSVNNANLADILNDHSIDAIIAFDTAYNVISWNKTAAVLYGVTKKNAIGKSLFQLIPNLHEDKESVLAIEQALHGYKSFVPASRLYPHRQHRENHYAPLNDGGNVIGVMNIVHDVAHRIKAEQQLQYLNEELERKMRQLKITSDELASFTYITSSKIKEPIRQIYTGVEHLIKLEAGHLSDSGRASFRRMQSSLNRMDLLLDDVLGLAQISILEKPETKVDLGEVISEVTNRIKSAEKKVIINVEEMCEITGHKNYLHLLFLNLFQNAVKFNQNDIAEITVTCKKVTLNEVNEKFVETEYYCITVTDNGIGFDMADAEKIFNMFEKLQAPGKYKGSGTGLAIARKIMDAHNGFIRAESTPGKGSSFHCYFPVEE